MSDNYMNGRPAVPKGDVVPDVSDEGLRALAHKFTGEDQRDALVDDAAEQIVLGTAMRTPIGGVGILSNLKPEHFGRDEHVSIWRVITSLWDAGKAATPVLVASRFSRVADDGAEKSMRAYATALAAGATVGKLLPEYIDVVLDNYLRRQAVLLAEELKFRASNLEDSVRDALSDAVGDVDTALTVGRVKRSTQQLVGQAAKDLIKELQNPDQSSVSIPTGLTDLDHMTGGLKRGELLVLAGRTSMGKSAVAGAIAGRIARRGEAVLYFALEMPNKAMAARAATDAVYSGTSVEYAPLLRGEASPQDMRQLEDAAKVLAADPLMVDDERNLSMAEITMRARRYAAQCETVGTTLAAVIVDHIGLVRPSGRYSGQRHRELAEITDQLAALAKDLNVAGVAVAQLNRGVEGRDNKRPVLADLRDSGAIEENAESVWFTYRPAYYLERLEEDDADREAARQAALEKCRNDVEVIIGKQRSGPTGTCKLFLSIAHSALRDRVPGVNAPKY